MLDSINIGESVLFYKYLADVAELADALDLGSSTARCVGSTPSIRTIIFLFGCHQYLLLILYIFNNKYEKKYHIDY